jgi:hypothetical protein
MSAKKEILALLDMAPDDVTLDEVIYWVQVMYMVRGSVTEKLNGRNDISSDLRKDVKSYFAKRQSRVRVRDTAPVEGLIP